MFVCLTHWSALECWRRIRQSGDALVGILLHEKSMRLPQGIAPSINSREAERLAEHLDLGMPLQLAVWADFKRNKRTWCTFYHFDTDQSFPITVCELEEGVYLPHPETVFIQLAPSLSVVERALLGYELSSSFVLDATSKTFKASAPLIDVQKIQNDLYCHSKRAMRIARQSLNTFMPGAESPAEIELAMKLFLPTRYGGFGLKGAELNPVIRLSEASQTIAGKTHCRADILFADAKLDVEYDSKLWHSTAQQKIDDTTRRIALRQDGYRVLPVTADDLRSPERLKDIAKEICRLRGRRLNLSSAEFAAKQRMLFREFQGESITLSRK